MTVRVRLAIDRAPMSVMLRSMNQTVLFVAKLALVALVIVGGVVLAYIAAR